MSTQSMLPQYQCHKKVWALKIVHIERITAGYLLHVDDRTETTEQGLQRALAAATGDTRTFWHPISVSEEWVSKHSPQTGGYYVRYEDGYESFSPAKAFEDGYTRIDREPPKRQIVLTIDAVNGDGMSQCPVKISVSGTTVDGAHVMRAGDTFTVAV